MDAAFELPLVRQPIPNINPNVYQPPLLLTAHTAISLLNKLPIQAKGEIIAENIQTGKSYIEIVRKNSDRIIDMVKIKIRDAVMGAKEFDTMYVEDIELGIECFTCFCFMECKILERPI